MLRSCYVRATFVVLSLYFRDPFENEDEKIYKYILDNASSSLVCGGLCN